MTSLIALPLKGAIPVPDFDACTDYDSRPPRSMSCSGATLNGLESSNTDIMNIYPEDLKSMLSDSSFTRGKDFKVLDCRFKYEFNGGRISCARNVNSKEDLIEFYNEYKDKDIVVVFHCEYSQTRGPSFMQMFREYDRMIHEGHYPRLSFPHIGLLQGGFKQFYELYPEECIGEYIPMRSKTYIQNGELRRCYSDYSNEINAQRRTRMSRVFGSRSPISAMKSEPISFSFDGKSSIPFIPLRGYGFSLSQSLWK